MIKMKVADEAQLNNLMDVQAYKALIGA